MKPLQASPPFTFSRWPFLLHREGRHLSCIHVSFLLLRMFLPSIFTWGVFSKWFIYFMSLLPLCLVCHLFSVLCLHSLPYGLFSSTFFFWKANCFLFSQVSPSLFSKLLESFSKLHLHSTVSNSLSPNFLLTIQPVCNLIIPTTTLLKTCSCKSPLHPLDCPSQGPLIPLELFA